VTTAVPEPTFGDKGFVAPTEADVLAGVQADINSALGGDVNPGLSTPQGQLATTETAIIGDKNAQFVWYTNQVDPALNSGRMQDGIGRIYFMTRIAGAPTVVSGICSGLDNVIIPVGSLVKAQDGHLYVCQQTGTIVGGSVTLPFACTVYGPVDCPADATGWTIQQAIFGWDSFLTESDGVLGRFVETRAEFEERRRLSVAVNAIGILDAIQANVLAVIGVLDAFVVDNVLGSPQLVGGFLLGPHSLYVCVLGGASQAIAQAIWQRKAPGCGYNGNTVETVVDPSPEYVTPVPSYQVLFERPLIMDFVLRVVMRQNVAIPGNAETQVRDAVLAAFAGTDGGPRAKIGSQVFASRYYCGIAALGSWAQLIEIKLGYVASAASLVGSITGTVLTVSNVVHGTLAAGVLLEGSGVASGTIISSLAGGTGGVGTYNVSQSQLALSQSILASTLVNDVQLQLNWAPAITAENVHLALALS
jgi:hypothetical protein